MTTLSDSIARRRTYYALSAETPISDDKIKSLIEEALKHTPSPFNMQSTRAVLLLGQAHTQVWDIALNILRGIVSDKQLPATTDRITSFRNAYGTILFYDDQTVIKKYMDKFPLYRDQFPVWTQQAAGMLQSNIWMLLEDVGFGASLQHYNPLIDERVRDMWHLPHHWKLVAQMPFGIPVESPAEKEFVPLKERFIMIKE